MIVNEESYNSEFVLEHHGVKGMRWGVRGTRRVQKRLDRTQRIAEGTASTKDRLLGAALTKKGAAKKLQYGANFQARINAGQRKTANLMHNISGVKVKELNFHTQGDPKGPTMSKGQKVAAGILIANGALSIARVAASG